MFIHSIDTFSQNKKPYKIPTKPAGNFRVFSQLTTDYFVKEGEKAFPAMSDNLKSGKNIVQTLYILDRIQENGTGDTSKLYPALSRYNKTRDAETQTFLAGIYRKTQVPDAFGPLVAMLIQNALNPQKTYFDPNEEIGGAIVSYFIKSNSPSPACLAHASQPATALSTTPLTRLAHVPYRESCSDNNL